MRGDSFSARRVEPGPKTTSVGMMAEPPALPCRDDVLVENGDASPKSCLPFLEMRSPLAAGGFLPTGETSTATRTTLSTTSLFGFIRPKRRIQRRIGGLRFYTSRMTVVSCLLPILTVWSSSQNQEKTGRSIQAVLKVVSAPARFWDRGVRCFVARLFVLEQLGEAAAFF